MYVFTRQTFDEHLSFKVSNDGKKIAHKYKVEPILFGEKMLWYKILFVIIGGMYIITETDILGFLRQNISPT